MNKIYFALVTLLLSSGFCLAEESSLVDDKIDFSKDEITLYESVSTALNFKTDSIDVKRQIIDSYAPALSTDWQFHTFTNNDLQNAKFASHPVRILDLMITNSERIHTISYTYFQSVNQIVYARKEFIYSNSDAVLNNYTEVENNSDMQVKYKTNHTALFEKKDVLDFTLFHVGEKEAMVVYMTNGLINTK